MEDCINISLSKDEALVLFEFFARFRETNQLVCMNNAEFLAMSGISGQLEKVLVEPFQANYKALLSDAQARLAEGFEGAAPGVFR